MPSVTVITVPTLRASVADWNFSMRALIRSLISDALMDIVRPFLIQEFGREPLEPAAQRAVDHQVVGTQDRAADQRRIDFAVQSHLAVEPLAQGTGVALLLLDAQRRGRSHRDVDDLLRFR